MKSFRYKINIPDGIRERQAGLLVREALRFSSGIFIDFQDKLADAKRFFAVIGLGIGPGDEVTVEAQGEDEAKAAVRLAEFFRRNL